MLDRGGGEGEGEGEGEGRLEGGLGACDRSLRARILAKSAVS